MKFAAIWRARTAINRPSSGSQPAKGEQRLAQPCVLAVHSWAATVHAQRGAANFRHGRLSVSLTRLFLLALTAVSASAVQAAEPVSALHCGKLFDSRGGKMLEASTIVVRDGKIAEVLPGKAEVKDAEIIDLSARTCMPGWTDLHVHITDQSNPKSYEEEFRLDDVDFGFRSVGYAEKTLQAGHQPEAGARPAHLRGRQEHRHHRRPCRPHQWLQLRTSHLIGPPGPTEGVVNSVEDARQAVRQRYKVAAT